MKHSGMERGILQPARVSLSGERLRLHLDRRNLFLATVVALLLHLFLFGAIWLLDIWKIQEMGEWSGPVLVKIGTSSALDSPETASEKSQEDHSIPQTQGNGSLVETASSKNPLPSSVSSSEASHEMIPESLEKTTSSRLPPSTQVRGVESGNSYIMDFDGEEGQVGRAGAYEFITNYMPLPEVIDIASLDGMADYFKMSQDDIRREIERYWEYFRGKYVKKPGSQGTISLSDRPYFWSILVNALNYDMVNADWKNEGLRPVVIEFKVLPSQGPRGAELTDFKMISRTDNPKIDEAILYGLSRWVYYNGTKHAIRGHITYNFDR